ncbi:hypothetical protein DFP73DRAFT_599083 [Morchella snyderi]|nr:hypothetical protein DFP73DRAFT_599083 [Morchella snyderi]
MVQYFNENGVAPRRLDILQAIHLIAIAWDSISTETIVNCWRKAGICGWEYQNQEYQNQGCGLDNQLQHFIAQQRTYCQIAMRQMFDPQSSFQTPDPEWAPAFDKYFTFDEDTSDSEVLNEYQLTTTFPDPFDNDPEMDEDLVLNHSGIVGKKPLSESPIATIDEAMHYSNEFSRYLQALKITELHTPSGKELPVSEIAQTYIKCFSKTKINKFFGGSLQSYKNGGATAPCIAIRSESRNGVYDDKAPELRYPSPLEKQDADGSEIEGIDL